MSIHSIPGFRFSDYLTLDESCLMQNRLNNSNFISSVSNPSLLCLLISFVLVVDFFGDHVYFLSPHSQSCDVRNKALLVFILDRGRCDWGNLPISSVSIIRDLLFEGLISETKFSFLT